MATAERKRITLKYDLELTYVNAQGDFSTVTKKAGEEVEYERVCLPGWTEHIARWSDPAEPYVVYSANHFDLKHPLLKTDEFKADVFLAERAKHGLLVLVDGKYLCYCRGLVEVEGPVKGQFHSDCIDGSLGPISVYSWTVQVVEPPIGPVTDRKETTNDYGQKQVTGQTTLTHSLQMLNRRNDGLEPWDRRWDKQSIKTVPADTEVEYTWQETRCGDCLTLTYRDPETNKVFSFNYRLNVR